MLVCIFCSEVLERESEDVRLGVCQLCEEMTLPANVEPAAEEVAA